MFLVIANYKLSMIAIWKILFLSLCHTAFSAKTNVDPEYLNMLRETGRHEEFAKLLGIEDVSLVHPLEGRTEEDLMFSSVSELGDILLTPEQQEEARQGLNFNRYRSSRWVNRVVPYVIGSKEFTKSQKSTIDTALRELNNMLENVEIVPRTDQQDYIYIMNGNGCYSNLGKIGGQQTVSLQANGCLRKGTIMHEFLHAMGMIHEHCRSDRDNYVKVIEENIEEEWRSQYQKVNSRDYVLFGPYDPYSVMHYPMSGSNGKPAFRFYGSTVNTRYVGQRNGPTDIDRQKAEALYS